LNYFAYRFWLKFSSFYLVSSHPSFDVMKTAWIDISIFHWAILGMKNGLFENAKLDKFCQSSKSSTSKSQGSIFFLQGSQARNSDCLRFRSLDFLYLIYRYKTLKIFKLNKTGLKLRFCNGKAWSSDFTFLEKLTLGF